ncbi:MAG: hypothetical protein ACJA1Z_001693 [Patiriisocius sp.]
MKSSIIPVIARIPITASKKLGDDRNTSFINSGDCVSKIEAVKNIYSLDNFLISFIAL